MKTISFINLKGGVGKTTVSSNVAYALAASYGAKVLFIDNDKQGNASSWFNVSAGEKSLTNILLDGAKVKDVVQKTRYENIDIIASDMDLMEANLAVLTDTEIEQQKILQKALAEVKEQYEICIIDNPPDINISVLNALVVTDEVIIITTPDAYGHQGVHQMVKQIELAKQYNPNLLFRGVLMNKFASTFYGFDYISELKKQYPVFKIKLRFTKEKMDVSTLKKVSIFELSPGCGFARDLVKFLDELLA